MIETKKIIQAVSYLLNKTKKTLDKIEVIKLIYLADKYHLLKYGRTITGDIYVAMPRGPVGSTLKDILSFNKFDFADTEYKYSKEFFKKKSPESNDFVSVEPNPKYTMLSETDRCALDCIVERFGNMKNWELVRFTHKYPEWKRYEELFKNGKSRRELINIEDLLSTVSEDNFIFTKEHIEEVREIIRARKC